MPDLLAALLQPQTSTDSAHGGELCAFSRQVPPWLSFLELMFATKAPFLESATNLMFSKWSPPAVRAEPLGSETQVQTPHTTNHLDC